MCMYARTARRQVHETSTEGGSLTPVFYQLLPSLQAAAFLALGRQILQNDSALAPYAYAAVVTVFAPRI